MIVPQNAAYVQHLRFWICCEKKRHSKGKSRVENPADSSPLKESSIPQRMKGSEGKTVSMPLCSVTSQNLTEGVLFSLSTCQYPNNTPGNAGQSNMSIWF